jgi:hypothetical protein
MPTDFPDSLENHTAGRYWGVSPESILLYTNATVTDSNSAWEALRRYYDLTVYVTNHTVEWEMYTEALETIVDKWFDSSTRLLAQHATAATAQQFVLGAAYEAEGGVMRILRTAQEYDDEEGTGAVLLARRDVKSIADEQAINLLRSLGVLRATMNGYEINREVVRTLHGSRGLTKAEACWAILARICEAHGLTDHDVIVPPLLEAFDIDIPDSAPTTVRGSLPIYAGDDRVAAFIDELFAGESAEVFAEIEREWTDRAERFQDTIGLRKAETPHETPNWPVSDRAAVVCAMASQHELPVAVDWLLTNEPAKNKFELHRELRDAGFEVSLDEDLLVFETPYSGPTAPDTVTTYESYVKSEIDRANTIATAARQLCGQLDGSWTDQRAGLLASTMDRLGDVTTAPIEFVFSMFDPIHHTDEYEIEEYVGNSPHLADEVDRIREWRTNQPHDAVTFAEVVREVCARPLEDESVSQRLRVMTPWLNFIVKEYTALFHRLLENGVQVQILFRLPDPDEWNDLKQEFLTRLGDTHGNLELRTYTRYKKFKDHTQLRKHKRGEVDGEGDSYVSETGIHAKLFIAGAPENGAVLAGSANLMENSFYYNPEAGLHTQHPEVIKTAADYFDLIWDLAEPDAIDESVYTGKTNFEFYPKVYRP